MRARDRSPLSMPFVTLIYAPEDLSPPQRAVLCAALPLAFPHDETRIRFIPLAEALACASEGQREVVLLAPNQHTEATAVLAAEDSRKLPRWGVLLLEAAQSPVGAEAVTWADFEPRLLARALRSSLDKLVLRRRLARERGDVWTIGRRLTHDLRNPLGCIVTTSEMLREMMREDAPEHAPLLEPIIDATGEMLDLINRVHVMAKASAQPRQPEPVDMEAPLQATIERLQREITRRHAEVQVPEPWPVVEAVQPWLETVWWNLLANALRHGGEPPQIETGWKQNADEWVFWVADRGPGVAADRVKQLFTPFDQLHQRHGGGIGLSIVHRLVELQGGRCQYEPRPGGGSIFSFTLPLTDSSSDPNPGEGGREGVRSVRPREGDLAAWSTAAG